MQNTSFAGRLTHNSQNTNFFQKSKRQIAGSGLLEKITFVQWRISEKIQEKTDNVNVIRLAALLATLPRMGIFAFEFSHGQLAKKFGQLYQVKAPSRKSICTWEHTLENLGLIQIPRHKASKPKTRVFTELFFHMARERMPKLSYTYVPVTWHPTNEDTQDTHTPKLTKNIETKNRADDIDHIEQLPARAPSQFQKNSRPPKHKTDGKTPKGLDKFENSVAWWLFQNKNRGSYRRACLIFAEFLKMADVRDPYYMQLKTAWAQCRDCERPGLVSDMIRNLEGSLPTGAASLPIAAPLCVVPDAEKPMDPEVAKLRIAMVFGGAYTGRYPQLLEQFNRATDKQQVRILKKLEQGKL